MTEMTEKEMFKVMDDYHEELKGLHEKQNEEDKNHLKSLKKYISAYKIKKIIEYLQEDCGYFRLDGIVDKKKCFGTKEEVGYWFKYIYLDQTTGHSGDDFYGTFFIPIIKDLFLRVEYEC